MASSRPLNGDETQWNGVETALEDPEEEKVVFVAIDSYL